MATWADVQRISSALPETAESTVHRYICWAVRGKSFVWERPLGRTDLEHVPADLADGPIVAAYVPDLGVKEALAADDRGVFFTSPHFNGHASILVRLDRIDVTELEELLTDAWLTRAPKRLAKSYLDSIA